VGWGWGRMRQRECLQTCITAQGTRPDEPDMASVSTKSCECLNDPDCQVRDFEKAGVHLPDPQRQATADLKARIAQTGYDISEPSHCCSRWLYRMLEVGG